MAGNQDYKGVRPESTVRKIKGVVQAEGGIQSKATGLILVAATADLPDPAKLPEGSTVFDSTESKMKIVVAGAYISSAVYS